MATGTLGTSATTSLTSLQFTGNMAAADVRAMAALIKNDINTSHPVIPASFSSNGILFVPNRLWIKLLPGDYVGIDSQGWPIIVSKNSIASGPWTHT